MIVLIDRARPERLGELVRHLVRERPETEVLLDAPSLSTVAEGSTVVLCGRAIDADWLNQERPVVQARSLRLVLFSDEATTLHLARNAVDFYDWISHCIDCPPGPPAFAVRALRRAACARAAAVVWQGGDLEGTFAAALPGRTLARVTAALPYPALVEALRPSVKEWIAVTEIDSPMRGRRVAWATAEAGRRGRLVLVDSVSAPLALPRIGALALTIEEGVERLRAAGVEGAARLAALLELSPGAIDDAARLARAGVDETELAAVAGQKEDPDAALGRLARTQGLQGATEEQATTDRRGRIHLPDWPGRIDLAFGAGDLNVASHWAEGWRKTTGSARSIAALARIRFFQQEVGEAQGLLREARGKVENGTDDATRFELLRAEGMECQATGKYAKATRVIAEALGLAERLGRGRNERTDLYVLLIQSLIATGRTKDAELTLNQWMAKLGVDKSAPLDFLLARSLAELKLAQGDAPGAARLLEQVLAQWPSTEENHPTRAVFEQNLAQAWLAQGRFGDAESLLRGAIQRVTQTGRSTTLLRHEYARALHGLGRFREAEQAFRRVMADAAPGSASVEPARCELARSLVAQGRLDEAEALLDPTLLRMHQEGATDSPYYAMALYEKSCIRRMKGDLLGAETSMRKVLWLEEKTRGREHPTIISTLMELSETLILLDKPAEAEPLLRRAVRLSEQAGDGWARARALAMLAGAHAAQGFPHARSTARQSLDAWKATGSEVPPAHLRSLEAIVAGALSPRTAPSRRRR